MNRSITSSESPRTRNRTLVYAAAGALIAALLILVGHQLDLRQPRLALDQQVAYNWLTLLFSPAAFLLRLTRPDDFIVPSFTYAVSSVVLNATYYSVLRKLWLIIAIPAPAAVRVASAENRLASGHPYAARSARHFASYLKEPVLSSQEAAPTSDDLIAETVLK